MYAAVVSTFDEPPTYQQFPEPAASGEHELVIDVIASGLHPRVRSQASGSHYTSTEELPIVPGVDGVGRDAEGRLRYFISSDSPLGAMAERTVVDARRSIVLPDDADPIALAAAMNPAMSSWVALRRRIGFTAGQKVLVLGATGSAGRIAVQVARRLGAGAVVAASRDAGRLAALPALGASDTVVLDDRARLGALCVDVDVVLDYVWGEATAAAMTAVVMQRRDRSAPLTWIEIGSVAGPTAAIPSAALRAARLQLVGSGQGSVPTRDIAAELPALAAEITGGAFTTDARAVPLTDVTTAWHDSTYTSQRLVLTM